MASPLPNAKVQFTDSNGLPLIGGKVYTYAAGTSTPKATYTTSAESVANTNPITLDSRGEADIWLSSGGYKIVLASAAGVTIWTVDNVESSGDLQADILALLSASSGASLIGFTQEDCDEVTDVRTRARRTFWVTDVSTEIGSGSVSDSAVFQEAFDWVKARRRKIFIPAPATYYRLDTTVSLTNGYGMEIECETNIDKIAQQCYFKRGSGVGTMFDFTGLSHSVFRNFSIDGNGLAAVGLLGQGNTSYRVTHNNFFSLFVTGCTSYGVHIGETSAYQYDATNFHDAWLSANGINLLVQGGNTEQLNFYGGTISGGTAYGVQIDDGGVNFHGTQFLNNPTADIYLSAPLQHDLNVHGVYSEGSGMFLLTANNDSASKRIINIHGGQILSHSNVTVPGIGTVSANIHHRNNMSVNIQGVKGSGAFASDMYTAANGDYVITSIGNMWASNGINPVLCANGVRLLQFDNQAMRIVGVETPQYAYTANDTIDANMSGFTYTNTGAGGGITLTLPAATVGQEHTFVRLASFAMNLDPAGSEIIRGGGAGKYMQLGSDGAHVRLVCKSAGIWEVFDSYGTITYEP